MSRYARNIINVKFQKKITIIVFIEKDLKSIFWHVLKHGGKRYTGMSQLFTEIFCLWSSNRPGTPTLLLIGSYVMGFTLRKSNH
jgi:hypothetical protein